MPTLIKNDSSEVNPRRSYEHKRVVSDNFPMRDFCEPSRVMSIREFIEFTRVRGTMPLNMPSLSGRDVLPGDDCTHDTDISAYSARDSYFVDRFNNARRAASGFARAVAEEVRKNKAAADKPNQPAGEAGGEN